MSVNCVAAIALFTGIALNKTTNSDFSWYNLWVDKNFIIKVDQIERETVLTKYLGDEKVVTIPEGVTEIDSYIFTEYFSQKAIKPNRTVEKIIIPDSVTSIKSEAFSFCTKLKEIQWPKNNSLKLGAIIFRGCTALTELTIPKNVKELKLFFIPDNLKTLRLHSDLRVVIPFYYDEAIFAREKMGIATTINFLLQNPVYKIIDGWMVNTKNKTALFQVDKTSEETRIPDGVEIVASYAFYETFLTEKNVGAHFNDYYNERIIPVQSAKIPKSVKKICSRAFVDCNELKNVIYEGKADDIKVSKTAFKNCVNFKKSGSSGIQCLDRKIGTSKRITQNILNNLMIIHKAIKSGSQPNVIQLVEVCSRETNDSVSEPTINRYIKMMKLHFNAPIMVNRKGGKCGYYYSDPNFELNLWEQ